MFYKMIFYLSLISVIYLITQVLALNEEGIIGGHLARADGFRYQAAILLKKNGTPFEQMICSAALLSSAYLLSAGRCFLDDYGFMYKLNFLVFVGSNNLIEPGGIREEIDKIYIPKFTSMEAFKDIAVSSVKADLVIFGVDFLSYVQLYHFFVPVGSEVVVSGYGFCWVKVGFKNGRQVRLQGWTHLHLKFAIVKVQDTEDCQKGYFDPIHPWEFCATMTADVYEEPYWWGICSKDAGSPLVFDNQIVAVASRNRPSCNDSKYGAIYTRVGPFSNFINNVMIGNVVLEETIVLNNLPHMVNEGGQTSSHSVPIPV